MTVYSFNNEKVFADSVDGQMIVLMTETGIYYTFSETASAVISDLTGGYSFGEVEAVLKDKQGEGFDAGKLKSFIDDALEKGILESDGKDGPDGTGERAPMECGKLTDPEDAFELQLEGYDDVASYFAIDPIHEVDPLTGWPEKKQED